MVRSEFGGLVCPVERFAAGVTGSLAAPVTTVDSKKSLNERCYPMETVLSRRVGELVANGWEPVTTTETTASLIGRRPFAWWLFLLVIFLFPLFGGLLYLVFWLATSKATVFLYVEDDQVSIAGDEWLIRLQESQRQAYVEKQRQIKAKGFLRVMWPQLVVSLFLIALWIYLVKTYL